MQPLRQLRELFEVEGIHPRKRWGQCFLIDRNLMMRLVELADCEGVGTVLEVGPATGSLTEELLARAGRVVACEIDRGLADILRRRLGDRPNLAIVVGDILAGKHALAPAAMDSVGPEAHLVANLPYNVATPLVALCLQSAWRALAGGADACRFDRLTFTVQKEVADRLAASPGGSDYGPISVLIALLARLTVGPVVPASAFWPAPKIASRIVRIDFDADAAGRIGDLDGLMDVVRTAFSQRRKQVGTIFRRDAAVSAALEVVGIDPVSRAQRIEPEQFAALAAAADGAGGGTGDN